MASFVSVGDEKLKQGEQYKDNLVFCFYIF